MINYKSAGVSTERLSQEYLALNSCGIERLSDIDRGSRRPRGRIDYHILYIERGVCYLEREGETVSVGAGGLILFRPHEPQLYHFLAADCSVSHYIHFSGTGCSELLKGLGIDSLRVFNMEVSGQYEEISARMVREYSMKRLHWESMVVGCLYELLSLIARKYALRNEKVTHESESRIGSACRRIYENLAAPPTIAELAAECCLSVSRFSHLFTEIVGKSPHDFTISLKMERARDLLEESQLSVKEIAAHVGYGDQNYFSRLFKERTGYSPRYFRSQLSFCAPT